MPLRVSLRAIKPKTINVKAMVDELVKEFEKETLVHRQLLGKTVSTWKNKPTFETKVRMTFDSLIALTYPAGNAKGVQQWIWVNYGTRRHPIKPRRARRLRFRTGYVAASTIGKFKSDRHFRYGPTVYARAVIHPGIEARNWTGVIVERRQRPFEQRMIQAMQRAASKAYP